MKLLITESQDKLIRFKRRLDIMWDWVSKTDGFENPCTFHNYGSFLSTYHYNLKHLLSISNEDFKPIWELFTGVYGEKMKDHYYSKCGKFSSSKEKN